MLPDVCHCVDTCALQNGKEHYVFFAFPHIAINSAGEIGAITRPGRPVKSCACGALQKSLIELKAEGYSKNCKVCDRVRWHRLQHPYGAAPRPLHLGEHSKGYRLVLWRAAC